MKLIEHIENFGWYEKEFAKWESMSVRRWIYHDGLWRLRNHDI